MQETHFGPVWFIPGENDGKYPFCHSLYIETAGILIDPASDRKRLQELRENPGVKEVWLSHWHEDHFMHLDLFDDLPFSIMEQDAHRLPTLKFSWTHTEWMISLKRTGARCSTTFFTFARGHRPGS